VAAKLGLVGDVAAEDQLDHFVACHAGGGESPSVLEFDHRSAAKKLCDLAGGGLGERVADAEPLLDLGHVLGAQVEADQGRAICQPRTGHLGAVDPVAAHDLVVDGDDGTGEDVKLAGRGGRRLGIGVMVPGCCNYGNLATVSLHSHKQIGSHSLAGRIAISALSH